MSGWGVKDDKPSTGTVAIATNGNVTGSSTLFTTEARVGDFLRATASNQEFVITSITSDTACTVTPARAGDSITLVGAGAQYTLSEKPKFLRYGFANNTDTKTVFGVDIYEMADPNHAGAQQTGWVHRKSVKTGAIAAVDNVGATDAARKAGIYLVRAQKTQAVFDGTIAGTTLTVASMTSGVISVGDILSGSGVTGGTTVVAQLTGRGGVGTYTVSASQTVTPAVTITAKSKGSTSNGSGVNDAYRISVSQAGAAVVEVVERGSGHADNDTITIVDSLLGSGGAADLTFDVNGVVERKRYESLVAISHGSAVTSPMGDAADDTYFPESPSPTPSVTPSVTATPSVTPSKTPSVTATPSVTPSITRTPSVTPSKTPSVTPSPSV